MTLLRRAIALLVASMVLVVAAPAFAQSYPVLTIANPLSLAHTDASGNAVEKRTSQLTPEGISLSDCASDLRYVLPLSVTNAPADARLEVWAGPQGSDCTIETSRSGSTATCTSVLSKLPVVTSSVSVPARAITAAAKPGAAADASICGAVDRSTVNVVAMLLSGRDTVASASLMVQVDTFPNPAPQAVVDVVQETVHVTASPDPNTTTTQLAVYCAAADGNDAGACTGSAISYAAAVPDADFDTRYRCVTIVKDMAPFDAYVKTSPDGAQFAVGTNIAVRVSSVDAFGNISPMSAPQCAVVETVADVDDRTGCATSARRGSRRGPVGIGSLLALVGLAIAARRRQASR